jgi:hypothetical protein
MPWTDKQLLLCFKMPSGFTITGRSSTIRNVFVAAIVPMIRPSADEIRQVLEILELDPVHLCCSYCGDDATEWEHLRPLVKEGRPTGFPSSIRNLVPACGKYNQSKGKNDWKTWMLGTAKLCPGRRGIHDLQLRIQRLERYETWANCTPLNIQELVPADLLSQYYAMQEAILSRMRKAQALAAQISVEIRSGQEQPTGNSIPPV